MKNKIQAFSFTTTSSYVGTGSNPFLMFDANGVNTAISGLAQAKKDWEDSTTGTIDPETIRETTKCAPIRIKGINYEVQNSSDFSNSFKGLIGMIDGKQKQIPNIISKSRRNTQFQSNLLTIETDFLIDGNTGILIDITKGTTVTITFFVESIG
jgi:hypothetical protein